LTCGEQGLFLKKATMTKGFGLELIESIINTTPELFTKAFTILIHQHPDLLKMVKDKICPLLVRIFPERNDVKHD
jgi:hypothetical protein